MASALGRIIRSPNGNGFQFVELDQSRQQEIIDKTIEANLEILKKCIKAVCQWYRKNGLTAFGDYEKDFIVALYDSVSLRISTLMSAELSRQIRAIKENGGEG